MRTTAKLNRKLLWYDFDQQKMLEFQGGELKFNYDGSNKALTVGSKDVSYVSKGTTTNEKTIQKWLEDNDDLGVGVVEQDNFTYAISFEDDRRQEVEASLGEQDLEYEVL